MNIDYWIYTVGRALTEGGHVCEYCGTVQRSGAYDLLRVFGSIYFFDTAECRDAWLSARQRNFKPKPEAQ